MRFDSIFRLKFLGLVAAMVTGVMLASGGAMALPVDRGLGFQEAASPVMEQITSFHDLLLIIITAIVVFVMLLLAYVMIRFREGANPEPSQNSHNTLLEFAWTVVPIIILAVIAVPSFRLLYLSDVIPDDIDMTIKATGHQWYWSYQYPEIEGVEYDSYILGEDELPEGGLRLFEVDNSVVVPVNAKVRMLVTASDVIHNWAMPALGVKIDAVPGRINETWFQATREGTFYGQCSELCGKDHAFMPIRVDVVSQEVYDRWVVDAQEQYAGIKAPEAVVETAAAAQ